VPGRCCGPGPAWPGSGWWPGPTTPEAVQGRLRDYHDKIRPVLELFEAKEVIVAVDATGPVAQVQAAIHDQLGLETSSA
jgi:adenylate kinase